MATPHVSGAVALVLERFPEVDRHAVRDVLTETARDVGPAGFDTSHGLGLIQIHDALTHDTSPPTWPTGAGLIVNEFGETPLRISWSRANDNRAVTGYLLRIDGGAWAIQPGLQATITGLTPGTVHSFEVLARLHLQVSSR